MSESHPGDGSLRNTKLSGPNIYIYIPKYIIIKTLNTQNRGRILKVAKDKSHIKANTDFPTSTLNGSHRKTYFTP
jgi:hypothetical protein